MACVFTELSVLITIKTQKTDLFVKLKVDVYEFRDIQAMLKVK
jgi:hypothetical protein